MRFGRECEYAFRAVIFLAQQEDDKRIPIQELAERQSVAPDHLARILGKLAIAGLVVRSPNENYWLARPAAEITLWQVARVYEEPLGLTRCLLDHGEIHPCERTESCPIHQRWKQMQSELNRVLDSCTFADLAHCASESAYQKTPET